MCMCVNVWTPSRIRREVIGSHVAGVTGSHELADVNTEIWSLVPVRVVKDLNC